MFESTCAIPVDRPRSLGLWACAAVLSLAIFSTGCLFHKKPQARVFVPPPPEPSKTANLKLPPVSDPPDLRVQTVDTSNELAVDGGSGIAEFPPPPQPARAPRRPQPAKPVVAQQAPVDPPPTPRLAQIFTPEQWREKNKTLDDSLERVQRELEALGKRNLNAEQRDRVEQIRDFQMQARQMREEDLPSAVSLAMRADQLAKDLLDHLP